MKWVVYFFLLLSGCGENSSKKLITNSKADTLIAMDSEYNHYVYEERDTLNIRTFYGEENHVLLGEIEVDSVRYNLFTVTRKVSVADGFRQSSYLLFRNEMDEIWYYVWNDEISCFLDVFQNKIVIRKENGVHCFEKFDSFAEELVFECVDGLLHR